MAYSPKTYEDWLALSDKQRKEVHSKEWNVYARDGLATAFMAAARFALQSNRKILNIQIGTYHGGEYLLQVTVSPEDFQHCPPMLAESFEGFRVVWCPSRFLLAASEAQGGIQGRWRAEEGDYEFEFRATAAGVDIIGRVWSMGEELEIADPTVNREYILFSAYEASRERVTSHVES